SGGFFGGGERPIENTEIINYYEQPDPNRSDAQVLDQGGSAYQDVYSNTDPDPDPDPSIADDYTSDDSGSDDDSNYVYPLHLFRSVTNGVHCRPPPWRAAAPSAP